MKALVTPLVIACAVAALSCGGGGSQDRSPATVFGEAAAKGSYAVGITTIDLDDTTRPTAANHEFPGAPDRKIPIDVWYPTAGAPGGEPVRDGHVDKADAPYAMLVFSHGLSATKAIYVSYAQYLASHGYVVVAPDYPLSKISAPGGPRLNAVLEQPQDVTFVIDQMLAINAEDVSRFKDVIDPNRIGATGHSLGAMTTFMSVYGPDRDERIKAALLIETPGCFFPEGYAADVSVPVLSTTGTDDLITPPSSATHVYDIAPAPRYLATIKGADHSRFADVDLPDTAILGGGVLQSLGQGDFTSDAIALGQTLHGNLQTCDLGGAPSVDPLLAADRQREVMRILEVVFFDGYLYGKKDSIAFLSDGLSASIPEVTITKDLVK